MTILNTPSAATPLDVERFPTAVLPKAVTPLSGNELMAILQSGTNVYVGVSDFLAIFTGGGGGNFSAGVSDLGNTQGQTGMNTKRLVLAGLAALTLSQATDALGATVSFNAPVQSEQTQNRFDLTLGGNTAGAGALVSSGTLTLAGGANITLSQAGNVVSVVGGAGGAGFSAGVSNLGNTLGSTGVTGTRLVLAGGNSVTLSQSTDANGATVTISGATTPAQTAESQTFGMSNLGNTSGTSGVISGPQLRMLLAGGPNVTLSQSINASSATVSFSVAAQSAESQSAGISNLGNTSGTSGIASGAQLRLLLAGGNNITLSQSLNGASATVTISAFNQSVQTQGQMSAGVSNLGNTAGSTGVSGTRMVLVGTNGISLSQSTDANGNTVSINFTQSAESNTLGMSNLGNTSGTSGVISGNQLRLLLAGGNNITLSQSINGSSATITISAFNQSVQTQGQFSAGASNLGNTAGATGISGTRMVLVGSDNITLSQTTDANGVTVSFIGPSPSGGGFSAGVSNIGNTAGSTGVTGTRLVLAGLNLVTLSQSTNTAGATISINAPNFNIVGGVSNLGNTLGTSGVVSSRDVRLIIVGTSNITISQSLNGASATLSLIGQPSFSAGVSNLGNTAGATGISGTQLVLVGTNNITLSQTTDANGATVSISGGAGGGGGNFSAGVSNLGNTAGSTGVTGTRLVLVGTNNITLSQTTDANGGTISIIDPLALTLSYFNPQDAYVQVTGQQGNATLHMQPMQAPNVQFDRVVIPLLMSLTSNSSVSGTLSFWQGLYTRDVSTLSLLSSWSVSTAFTIGTSNSSLFAGGIRLLTIGTTGTITEGQYWMANIYRTSTAGSNILSFSQILASQQNSNLQGLFGVAGAASVQYTRGLGTYSATTAGIPNSIAFSQLTGTGSIVLRQPIFYFVSGTV